MNQTERPSLLLLLHGAIKIVGCTEDEVALEFRRGPRHASDVTFHLRPSTDEHAAARLIDHLTSTPAVAHVLRRGSRLEVRVQDYVITELMSLGKSRTLSSISLDADVPVGPYIVDFCDPNATKPLHLGHLRNISLGRAFAQTLKWAGFSVTTQSIICDIGRAAAEAIAGYQCHFRNTSPQSLGCRTDVFVGRCYEAYVKQLKATTAAIPEGDAPIEREIMERHDLADELMKAWLSNYSPDLLSDWRQLMQWAVSGQNETLSRLSAQPDHLIFESNAMTAAAMLLTRGQQSNFLTSDDLGRWGFSTGREQYKFLPFTRSDGFPTEHLRAFAIWDGLFKDAAVNAQWIHVIGDEWAESTYCRIDLHKQFGHEEALTRYQTVFYGMVRMNGYKMKSSDGKAQLIEHVIEQIANDARVIRLAATHARDASAISHQLLTLYMLSYAPERTIDFTYENIFAARGGALWNIIICYSECSATSMPLSANKQDAADGVARFISLSAVQLPSIVSRSLQARSFEPLVAFLGHFASSVLREPSRSLYQNLIFSVLSPSLRALGAV